MVVEKCVDNSVENLCRIFIWLLDVDNLEFMNYFLRSFPQWWV